MQRINDKLKSLCKFCSSHLDKPCAWISLGNEYCDRIMDIQSELNNRIPRKDIEILINKYKYMCMSEVEGYENYFKNNENELVYRRFQMFEKELLNKE